MTSRLLALFLAVSTPADDAAVEEAPAAALEHGKAATADASPVDPGALEAELGWAPAWNRPGGTRGFAAADRGSVHAFSGTLTYGAAPDVDVKLSSGWARISDAAHQHDDGSAPKHGTGVADTVVGARWRFLNRAEQALELAVTGDLAIPTGTDHTAGRIGVSQGFWSARGALVATKDLGALTANCELAIAAPVSGDAGGFRSLAQVNAALGWQLAEWLQPELELNYAHTAALGPDAQVLAVTAGVVAPWGAGHRIVAAVQQGLWGRNATETTAAVLSFKTAL